MPQFPKVLATGLCLLLIAFVIYKGLLPAFTEINTDFPNYYTAGKIAASGENAERLYSDEWFQEQIHDVGIEQQGKFSPLPPPTAILFVPLSYLPPQTALQVFTLLNLFFLLASVLLLARVCSFSKGESLFVVLLSGIGLVNCLRFGQLYIALSLTIIAGFYLLTKGKTFATGLCFGALSPIKYFPMIFILYYAIRKEWRLTLAAGLAMGGIVALSVAMLGLEVHIYFISSVFGEHLQSNLTQQNPFSFTFQSFDSLFRRLFVSEAILNPEPLLDSPALYHLLKWGVVLILIGVAIYRLSSTQWGDNSSRDELSIATLGILGLLVAPATATYHYLLMWLPVGLLLKNLKNAGQQRLQWMIVGTYSAIGFIPYSFFRQFEGSGALTPLAYPRLWLMLLLIALALKVVERSAPSPVHRSGRGEKLKGMFLR